MKKLFFFLLPVLLFACNGPDKQAAKPSQGMRMAAILPSGQSYDTLANGDTLFYISKDTTVGYTYKIERVEKHPKKAGPVEPGNQAPIARAGNDQTITLPVNSVKLDASASTDPEGATLKYFWRKVTGPSATMSDTGKVVATASNLVEGVYTFEVRAVDPLNAFTADFIAVTVKKEVTTPPTGSTVPFSLQKNPAFKKRNFAGFENWNGQNYTQFTGGWSDLYFRFVVSDFLKGSSPTTSWARFDQEIKKAIAVKGKFAFGIFLVNDSDDFLASESFGGASARYPLAWHNQMQAEGTKDFTRNGMWIPNWNSPSLNNNIDKLLLDIAKHISDMGWNDVINYTDIRIYGQWGEWHNGGLFDNVNQFPAGTKPTAASYKRWIDAHIKAFPKWPLVCLFAAYDANYLPHTMTPPEITHYMLTARNEWGLIGWRRDQWGQTDNYISAYLQDNNRSYNGVVFKNLIMERWKYAPVVGEPYGPGANLSDLARQAAFYHATSIGNGNYTNNSTSNNQFKAAEDAAGYKLSIGSGKVQLSNVSLTVDLSIENFGNAPCYEGYDLVFQVKNASGATVATASSAWHPLLKLPGVHSVPAQTWAFPSAIPSGNYTVTATFKNSYRTMPLFNNGQASDGSIPLVTVSVSNQ